MKRRLVAMVFSMIAFPALAFGQIAEEIRSETWCRQAVELAQQRGETPAQQGIVCEIDYIQPPDYWKCVLDSMRDGERIVSATEICMESLY